MSDIANELINKQQRLASKKSVYDEHCREVAQYVIPRLDSFSASGRQEGAKRSEKIFDSLPNNALEIHASIMQSLLTPTNSKWHGLGSEDEKLQEDHEALIWYDKVRDFLFRMRYGEGSNFANQKLESYYSSSAFGTGVMILQERPGRWLSYKSSHISEHFFMENDEGVIDYNCRRYKMTARQAVQSFGYDNLSEKAQKIYDKTPDQDIEFIHAVFPNEERKYGMIGAEGMRFKSFHVEVEGRKLIAKPGGYRRFPFIIERYQTAPGEVYGRSPAMTALAEIKMLHQVKKTDIKARHLSIAPPTLAANESSIRRLNLKPDAINYGTLDMAGNPLVRPYQSGARIEVSQDMIEASHKIINDIFLVSRFQILVDTPEMTATQSLQREREKADLMSPLGVRQETETLQPLIAWELDSLSAHGYFDEGQPLAMPRSVRDAGGAYKVVFTSPLSQMRMAAEAIATQRTVEAVIPLLQFDPAIADNYNWDEFAKIMKRAHGAPEKLINAPEVKKAIREQRAQQQQMASMVQAAPEVAGAVKDIAQAQAMGNA